MQATVRRVGLAVGVAFAVTVTTVAVATSAGAATLFTDDFADGNSTGWTTSGGTWQVTSAEFRQTGTSSDARARAGSTAWTDYTVTARIRPTAFNVGFAVVLICIVFGWSGGSKLVRASYVDAKVKAGEMRADRGKSLGAAENDPD